MVERDQEMEGSVGNLYILCVYVYVERKREREGGNWRERRELDNWK